MSRASFFAGAIACAMTLAHAASPVLAQGNSLRFQSQPMGGGGRANSGFSGGNLLKQSGGGNGSGINLQQLGNLNSQGGRRPGLSGQVNQGINQGINIGNLQQGNHGNVRPIGIKPEHLLPGKGPQLNPIKNPGKLVDHHLPQIDPGFGNGQHNHQQQGHNHQLGNLHQQSLKNTLLKLDWHDHHHHDHQHWNWFCQHQPSHTHWWFDYCTSIHTCSPGQYQHGVWHQCPTMVLVDGVPIYAQAQWYLGLKGMILPGVGIGVESVERNSPAEFANLQPGMVLVSANGIRLLDEASLNEAIVRSNGTLTLEVVTALGQQSQFVQIQLQVVRRASF